jgi:Tfp pilus assembly protein PilF
LREATKIDEKSVAPRYALANFYRRTGKADLAEAELIEAVKIQPKDSGALITLGDFYASVKRMEDADLSLLFQLAQDIHGNQP